MHIAHPIPLVDTWGMHGDVGWGWMVLMMALMVLFWAAVIFGIVWLIRAGFDHRSAPRSESPTDILDRRFAEGAISPEDYRARRELLTKPSTGSNGSGQDEQFTAPHKVGAKQ